MELLPFPPQKFVRKPCSCVDLELDVTKMGISCVMLFVATCSELRLLVPKGIVFVKNAMILRFA
jgi:hypothetical protein